MTEDPTPPSLPAVGAWVGQLWDLDAPAARAAARRLEDAGYGVLWISEAFGREVLSFAAVLLAATERIKVATGIANLWARDAVATANGGRTLAEAFPGRFLLGVGISHAPLVDRRGHDYRGPLEATRRYLTAMREATYRGPAPAVDAPVVVGALGDRMLALSAELADGAHPYLVTPGHTRRARQVLGAGKLLAPEQPVVLSTDPVAARAAARAHLATYLRLDNYRRSLLRQGFTDDDLADGGSDRLVDALVAWGDADAIAARVQAHLDAGADHVCLQVIMPGMADDPRPTWRALTPTLLSR